MQTTGYSLVEKSSEMNDLLFFASESGVTLNPKVAYPANFYPGYWGVVALEALDPFELILSAHNSSLIPQSKSNSESLKPIYIDHPEDFAEGNGGENNRFIVLILSELSKGRSSKWWPYLETLPKDIEVLSDWSLEELEELQDEVLLQYNVNKNAQEEECNTALKEILSQYPQIISQEHLGKIAWAWKVICTRAYGRCLPCMSLVPVADFFNHANVETNYYYGEIDEDDRSEFDETDEDHDDPLPVKVICLNFFKMAKIAVQGKKGGKVQLVLERAKEEDRKLFVKSKEYLEFRLAIRGKNEVKERPDCFLKIVAPKEGIEQGKQVCIQYGRYSNRQLLCQYGFAMSENKYDYYSVRFDLTQIYQEKNVPFNETSEKEFLEFKLKKHSMNQELLQFLAAKCWNSDEHTVDDFFLAEKGIFYNSMISKYKEVILEEISKFPTTLQEDLKMMNKVNGYRKHFALIYRIKRKEILQEHLRFCNEIL
jgi:hypothetical protein